MPKLSSKYIQVHIARYDEDENEYKYLVLKRSDNVVPYPGMWQVITGNIEKGETSIDAAKREVHEETGIIVREICTIPYVTNFFNHKNDTIYLSPVFGVIVNSEKCRLSEEHCNFKWLTYDELMKILELPTHREASTIYRDYILNNENREIFNNSLDQDQL